MAKTLYWQAVPGVVHIAVHTDETPSDEDWAEYLDDAAKHVNSIKGAIIYTKQAGPSAAQRSRAAERFRDSEAEMRTAIMTSSRMVIGIVTALGWVAGNKASNMKAFSTTDFTGAAKYLGLTDEEQIRTRVVLRHLARAADRDIDAFAEESGRYRRKMD